MLEWEINQILLASWQRLSYKEIDKIIKTTCQTLRKHPKGILSIAFVSERTMCFLNETYYGRKGVTDVLSFSFKTNELFGEIILCFPELKRQAKVHKHSAHQEIVILLIHGLLHLFDFDHQTLLQKHRMEKKEQEIFNNLSIVF
ncbi:rRNA maturation RNase YbeY [Candidatus Uhrbacteria bacterium CG_4_9_14_3_um_filter_36_7]|uniref:Endoribonuclease YbeY n=1 Tax=Candidatus Uhrbacteria bacterium CG_4_9_14_3_um_filter_36_7 TaxID=1975033 RepID=A0A2M7XI67_9BACT|nr:MAG: rRNA maturation RNase YbeY [Candidatus Uhrbacteria bacterium CG_4_9_14_3_um_filter_36_7]